MTTPKKVFVVGVGMTRFTRPGASDRDYPELVLNAVTKALLDAGVNYDSVQFAAVGYVYADSTAGQRALYQLGLTQIPIVNVNNNCSTGSTALYTARNAIAGGQCDVALAVGFEKMNPGSLSTMFTERTNPLDWAVSQMAEKRGLDARAPIAAQIFCNAALEYAETHGATGAEATLAMDTIASKSHMHSTLNPYSQFTKPASIADVHSARSICGPLTLLHCSPTSDGAACALLMSEEFVIKNNLAPQAVEIVAQVMATDSVLAFDPAGEKKSCVEIAGADMTRSAAKKVYAQAGIKPADVNVCELHDCFSGNELITYDALGFCKPGQAIPYTLSGATFLPKFKSPDTTSTGEFFKIPVNTSGGLISKGHPLGATGLAQCSELVWQLRGWCGARQVPNARLGLQHNIGLGGAAVVTLYAAPSVRGSAAVSWRDPRERVAYNPAVECRDVSDADVKKVASVRGGLIAVPQAAAAKL